MFYKSKAFRVYGRYCGLLALFVVLLMFSLVGTILSAVFSILFFSWMSVAFLAGSIVCIIVCSRMIKRYSDFCDKAEKLLRIKEEDNDG